MTKVCLVVEHLAVEHPGTFKPVFELCGYEVISVPAAAIRRFRGQAEQAALLVVMGGPIGVYDAPEYPFLTEEIEIIQARLEARRPVLGVCLGSQLMAAALGANVFPGSNGIELGWAPVRLTKDGEQHALAEIASDERPVLHWHGDTFDLPSGARLLASTSRYAHQAFSVGNYGLALQFHVETDADELEQWFVAFAGDIRKMGPDTLVRLRMDTARYAPDLADRNARFVKRWLSQL
jgi:GMP synthase (glutamine-hydrolysing)